jgi:hypothetical protein
MGIGHLVLSVGFVVFLVWIASHSPLFRWVVKMFILTLWGLMTVGATLFVIVAIYIPNGSYGAAAAALLVGGFISVFWATLGLPELLKEAKNARRHFILWE